MSSIPLADVAELVPAARRTALLRGALTGLLLATLALAYLLAPAHDLRSALAAGGRGNVIVLDQSGSIDDPANARLIRRQLLAEVHTLGPNGRTGLVLFSDSAVEALPPAAPVRALLPFRRFFVRRKQARKGQPAGGASSYPVSPWNALVGGTTISSGLRQALSDLHRAGLSGGDVLLVSDLLDSPTDTRALRRVLHRYAASKTVRLQVRVLPSSGPQQSSTAYPGAPASPAAPAASTAAMPKQIELYRRILGAAAVRPARLAPTVPAPTPARPVALWLLAAAVVAAAVLGLHELLAAPVRWRRVEETTS